LASGIASIAEHRLGRRRGGVERTREQNDRCAASRT
jgi:hypothetical protein